MTRNSIIQFWLYAEFRSYIVFHKGKQVVDEEGNSVWCFDGKNAIRALELLGKHKGMWVEKQELTGANGGPIDNQLTIRLVRPNHADR